MSNTKAVVAAICTLGTAAVAQEDGAPPAPPPPAAPVPGFHVVGSGLVGFGTRGRDRYGFAFDGQFELAIPYWLDLAGGAGFERLDTGRGPLTATFAEAWAQRHAPLASFFGVGLGAAFVNRAVHPAAKMSAGIEAFHDGPVPIQLGVDFIATWCTNASDSDCGTTQARTYFAGRLGLRM